jgi:hypothetical protein
LEIQSQQSWAKVALCFIYLGWYFIIHLHVTRITKKIQLETCDVAMPPKGPWFLTMPSFNQCFNFFSTREFVDTKSCHLVEIQFQLSTNLVHWSTYFIITINLFKCSKTLFATRFEWQMTFVTKNQLNNKQQVANDINCKQHMNVFS